MAIMQIKHRDLSHGKMKLVPNTLDDLWHLYHLIQVGDTVEGHGFRRIRYSSDKGGRADKGERKRIRLAIQVDKVDFHAFSDALRVKGIITETADDIVSLGTYHTFNVVLNTPITLIKTHWDKFALNRLKKAVADTHKAQLAVLAIEDGHAQLATLTNIGINPGPQVIMTIPGKRSKNKEHTAVFQEFINSVLQVVSEFYRQKNPSKLIIVGPGSTKDSFFKLLQQRNPDIAKLCVVETASSGTTQGVNEALNRGKLFDRISELDVLQNTRLMEEFLAHIGKETGLAAYGADAVRVAAQTGAIQELLVSESLLRNSNVKERGNLEKLINLVEKQRAQVHFLSTLYPAGKQLEGLGGLAAVLRFVLR